MIDYPMLTAGRDLKRYVCSLSALVPVSRWPVLVEYPLNCPAEEAVCLTSCERRKVTKSPQCSCSRVHLSCDSRVAYNIPSVSEHPVISKLTNGISAPSALDSR
jgi:hypothetical protein